MFNVVVQKELSRDVVVPNLSDVNVQTFSAEDDWQKFFKNLNENLTGPTQVHCSLQIAKWIKEKLPGTCLSSGVSLPSDFINAHQQMGKLGNLMFNEEAFFLPFGHIRREWNTLKEIFGPDLFLRPDSCLKPFSGRPLLEKDFELEMGSIEQIERIPRETLCQISPYKNFTDPEWRCWMVDGEIATYASYAFNKDVTHFKEIPQNIVNLAREAADKLIDIDSLIVIDCVQDEHNNPKVMEANGFSTSGFYEGMDCHKLWLKTQEIYGF